MNLERVRLNPGGALDPDQVVGRDLLLQELLDHLKVQSVLLVAERRSGKTTVLRLLQDQAPATWSVVKISVEGVTSPEEFVRRLAEATNSLVTPGWRERLVGELDRFGITAIGGVQRRADAGVASSWKDALATVLQAISSTDRTVVFLLDEFPFMLAAVARERDKSAARDVLNMLRSAREEHDMIRFVLTGSIGLHHILDDVRDGSWAPINDLAVVTVTPLDDDAAQSLAAALLRNEDVACLDGIPQVAQAVATLTEGAPYYIHLLVGRLKHSREPASVLRAEQEFDAACNSPQDPWSLRHLERRLVDYHGEQHDIAARVLDAIAVREVVHFRELLNIMSAHEQPADQNVVRQVLDDLQRDHYLKRAGDGFAFRLEMIRRVWRSLRYIEAEE